MNRRVFLGALAVLALVFPSTAWANKHAVTGTVLDRNGEPLERVNVTVFPGNVEIITDETGKFLVDYLRDEEGNRTRMQKRTEYSVTFFKLGYHEEKVTFFYKRGEHVLDAVTLKEETIKVDPSSDNIDPAGVTNRQQDAGGSYEGE